VDGDRPDHHGDEQAAGDAEDRGRTLRRDAVREADGDEHDREGADEGDEHRRRALRDRRDDEPRDEQEAEGESNQCEDTAPARHHDDERRESEHQPQQGHAPVDACEHVWLDVLAARRRGDGLDADGVALLDARRELRRAERERRRPRPDSDLELAATLRGRPGAADVAHDRDLRANRLAAEGLRATAAMFRAGPERNQPDYGQERERGDRNREHEVDVPADREAPPPPGALEAPPLALSLALAPAVAAATFGPVSRLERIQVREHVRAFVATALAPPPWAYPVNHAARERGLRSCSRKSSASRTSPCRCSRQGCWRRSGGI
jgi:hypothetical protein